MISHNTLSGSTLSAIKKREDASRTPIQGARTPIMMNSEQRRANSRDSSRGTIPQTESSDNGQLQRSKSALRLDKSQTGSTSSYKSSSITGPQETQESITFAVNEIGNKVSKSAFSGDAHEEEEFTAQFEPFKTKIMKGQNEGVKGGSSLNTVIIMNDKSGSIAYPINKRSWKEVVKNMKNQSSKDGEFSEKTMASGDVNMKKAGVSNNLQSLLEVNDMKTGMNLMKVSVQQQLNAPPKSPIIFNQHYQDVLRNLSNVPKLEKLPAKEQTFKNPEKEANESHNSSKAMHFKDYLQKIQKGSNSNVTSSSISNQQAKVIYPKQVSLNDKTDQEKIPNRQVVDVNLDNSIRQKVTKNDKNISQNLPVDGKITPKKQVNEKLKEVRGLMTAGIRNKTTISPTITNSAEQLYPKSKSNNFSPGPRPPILQPPNQAKTPGNANRPLIQTMKGLPLNATHMVAGLPVIFEDPEISLKVKKSGSRHKLEKEESKSQQSDWTFPRERSFNCIEEEGETASLGASEVESDSASEYETDNEESNEGEEEESESVTMSSSQSLGGVACEKKKQQNEEIIENTPVEGYTQISEESEEEENSESGSGSETEDRSQELSGAFEPEETQEIEKGRSFRVEERMRESVGLVPEGCEEESEEEDSSGSEEEYEYEESSESHSCTQEPINPKDNQYAEVKEDVIGREEYQQFNQMILTKADKVQGKMQELEEPYIRNYDYNNVQSRHSHGHSDNNTASIVQEQKDIYEDQRDMFFKHSSLSSLEFILKKYNDIESKLWDIQGRQWMFDKEVRIMQVSLKVLNERIDDLYDLAEDKPNKKDIVLSLTSSELNQIFEDNT